MVVFADDDIWAVGGAVVHFDGSEWQRIDMGNSGYYDAMSIWGTSSNDLFIVDAYGYVFHFDGSTWTKERIDFDSSWSWLLYSVWGSSQNDVFVVGRSIHHFDGSEWTQMEIDLERSERLTSVWGSSGNDVFAVGRYIYHFNGSEWTRMEIDIDDAYKFENFQIIEGSSADNVFAVGKIEDAWAHFYDGSKWTLFEFDEKNKGSFSDVLAVSEKEVYIVGGIYRDGKLYQFDGDTWKLTVNAPTPLSKITRSPDGDIYVGGGFGYVGKYAQVPPFALVVYPRDGQDDVSLNTNVQVNFSEDVVPSSVAIVLKDGSHSITGALEFKNDIEVSFFPSESLKNDKTYVVEVTAKDLAGNSMAPYSWSFSTRAVPTVPIQNLPDPVIVTSDVENGCAESADNDSSDGDGDSCFIHSLLP